MKATRDVRWWASIATILALFVSVAALFLPNPLSCFVTDTPPPVAMDVTQYYVASGWMGDTKVPKIDWGKTITVTYEPSQGTNGYFTLFWQYPANNWICDYPGRNLEGANRITVTAWGETGGEIVKFGAGVHCDSLNESSDTYTLTTSPQKYVIAEFQSQDDLSNVVSPFHFSVDKEHNKSAITFYLSDISVEGISEPRTSSD